MLHFDEGTGSWTMNAVNKSVKKGRLGGTSDGDAAEPTWRAWNYTLNDSLPLPIELTSFVADVRGNDVVLTWKTLSEHHDVVSYEVQRKVNDKFVTISEPITTRGWL